MATEPFLLHQLRPFEPGGVALTHAAASIALSHGQPQTIVDILHGRAFRYYAEGLRQYLCIRTGSVERAEHLLTKLRAFVARSDSESLIKTPGIRARLYRAARGFVQDPSRALAPPDRDVRQALPWRALPSPHGPTSPLNALRFELSEEHSELLELRYARELGIEELAFVFAEEPDAIEERVEAAVFQAKLILDEHGIRDTERFARILVEAFALEARPRTAEDELEGAEPLAPGTTIGGRYSVQARVGLGAFGDVYRAKDTEVPGHVVALKLLHQPAHSELGKQSALRELRLIASVFHPSIVQFKDHGWFEGRLWFVMPWYDGETLESRLQRGPLGRSEALKIFQPLARALAAMHAAGVRHQDVKPENIFLARIPGFGEEEVMPVLLDLGVAASEAEMVVAGTPTYFAPEVAAQFASVETKPAVTNKADIFGLALSLRNALEPETQADVTAGAVDTFIEQRAREVPSPPQGKKLRFLEHGFARWMNLDADARPTADELAEELTLLTRPERRRKRTKTVLQWAIPMAATVLGLAGVAVTQFYRQAEAHKQRAAQAQLAEAGLRQDLEVTREAAEQLELRYEQSRLTRAQLATRLARTDGRVAKLEGELRNEERKLSRTRERLSQTRSEKTLVEEKLSDTQAKLVGEENRSRALERDLQREEELFLQARAEISAQRARLRAEARKTEEIQSELAKAIADRSRAELELEFAEEELEALRRKSVVMPEAEPELEPAVEPALKPDLPEDSEGLSDS
jgi:hypothetical protein